MRPSSNVIEDTLLAFALTEELGERWSDAGLDRVRRHYGALLEDPAEAGRSSIGPLGLALFSRRRRSSAWPFWSDDPDLSVAFTATPTGWSRVIGKAPPGHEAALQLGRAIAHEPSKVADLNPPFAIAVLDRKRLQLTVATDALGVGRLYELQFPGGTVWSNRLGALTVFAGTYPRLDEDGWGIFAACGWFVGTRTPIAGARKVGGGEIRLAAVKAGGQPETVETTGIRDLVAPRRASLEEGALLAAEQIRDEVSDLARVSDGQIAIALTGGRDSRLSAAGAVASGVDARFNTGDHTPGELDVVQRLIASAPVEMPHDVFSPERDDAPGDDLNERVRRIHLVHDGMRNPQELRRPTEIPFRGDLGISISGHGGELGHGFYYNDRKRLRQLRRGGHSALIAQLERSARRKHSVATDRNYALFLVEAEASLKRGVGCGLAGPTLLDYFYLEQRLTYRSGLGSRSHRASPCVTPAFVRAAFDLSPKDRLEATLHRAVVAELVPRWRRIHFFSGAPGPMPEIKRKRLWERPEEAAVVDEMLADATAWGSLFEPETVRRLWAEVRAGRGSADFEHVIYRLIWRVGYEKHLRTLRESARS